MIFKLCDIHFKYQLAAVCVLYAVYLQKSCLDLCDPKSSRSDGACDVYRVGRCSILIYGINGCEVVREAYCYHIVLSS
jgi:hypothetical protein